MFERLQKARRDAKERNHLAGLIEACRELLTVRGDANSVAIASRALECYRKLASDAVREFFAVLANEFDPDPGEVLMLAEKYAVSRSPENLIALARAAEPPRQELLRRLNRAPLGTATIVAMRAQLLARLRTDKRLRAVDADFEHLLGSWFNPGFLRLERVDWASPASLLEKIIQHEAVHEIDGWNDLRRRLEPDRRCFAFFHPVLPDEPLIFVEVALLSEIPGAIAPLLDRNHAAERDRRKFKVAAFYSISNCQPGLRGVNLGNFLIKEVAEQLHAEFPSLKTFCTLSPVPSFAHWLARVPSISCAHLKPAKVAALDALLARLRARNGDDLAGLRPKLSALASLSGDEAQAGARELEAEIEALRRLCAFYLMHGSHEDPEASDPVARFHLNNGARLERVNAVADLSRKGLRQSFATMVNYLYDLDQVEANHERYIGGEVTAARAVGNLL
ncbi:MAG: malonyl-CoA decarboxylase family protein [Burkholderiaceae bacterium]|nr:malonyl-CoA decarboxylase family protein [Burkholderiaceae bacterium]